VVIGHLFRQQKSPMPHITRRQFFGIATIATLAGCSREKPTDPPLRMGPPLEKSAAVEPSLDGVPEQFQVKFETSKGDFVVHVHRDWSPNGAARFYELVQSGFYDDCRFFRVVSGFMAQFGIHGDPKIMEKWRDANIPDDRPAGEDRKSNTRGHVTFAKADAPNSRSTQLFINYGDNSRLDATGFTPFGHVAEGGMEVVDALNSKYGEEPSQAQGQIQVQGNKFLDEAFPGLDYIKKATILDPDAESKSPDEPQTDAPAESEK
jgi:cyclophilin family peptidyl-prolyl cis-trans isomerase